MIKKTNQSSCLSSSNMILLLLVLIVAMILADHVVLSKTSGIHVCSQKFYSNTTCIDQTEFYTCRCPPGFIWNGEMCVSTSLNSYFEFEEKPTNAYVLLERTFPGLKSFTIATWLQILNYTATRSIVNTPYLQNDTRTIFSYSFEPHVNVLRCQISSTIKHKSENSRKVFTNLFFSMNIFDHECNFKVVHNYVNNSFWLHLAITWNKDVGKLIFYINGQLKWTCPNMALNRELITAGAFVLGQSHHVSYFSKKVRKYPFDEDEFLKSIMASTSTKSRQQPKQRGKLTTTTTESYDYDQYSAPVLSMLQGGAGAAATTLDTPQYDDDSSVFEVLSSFMGRLFNFNVWQREMTVSEIQELYGDCRLTYCGDAVQWSDFRQGTRGEVKMKWPTELLWQKTDHSNRMCLSEKFQYDSCNKVCQEKIGPICREHVDKNIRWPLTQANRTSSQSCTPNSTRMAVRNCRLRETNRIYENKELDVEYNEPQLVAEWEPANVDECIQKPLLTFRDDVYEFCMTDNFDETQIIGYLESLYDLSVRYIKLNNEYSNGGKSGNKTSEQKHARSIYDIAAVLDTMTYIVNAQHQVIRRNLQISLNLGYPTYEDMLEFVHHILAVLDVILETSQDTRLWSASEPIGSESMRVFQLVRQLSASVYDYQQFNLTLCKQELENGGSGSGIGDSLARYLNYLTQYSDSDSRQATNTDNTYNITSLLPFLLFDIRYPRIAFRQQLLFHEHQMPMSFRYPESSPRVDDLYKATTSTRPSRRQSSNKRDKNKKKKTTNSPTTTPPPPVPTTYPIIIGGGSGDYFELTTPLPSIYHLDNNSFVNYYQKSASSSNSMPSIYFGKVLFNEHNLLLPLSTPNETIDSSYGLLTVYYSGIESLLPNHNKTFLAKDNNVNSIVMTVELLGPGGPVRITQSDYNQTICKPINVYFNFLTNFNISDTRCVYLEENREKNRRFKWSRDKCRIKEENVISTTCECTSFGTYTITNDLYDPNWKPLIIENVPLTIPSYFGCVVVSLFCIFTFCSLTYLKTKSSTTSIHKNLCISICLSQLLLMISLSKNSFDNLYCRMLALLSHYMFLVVFAWLMNEGFNLYIKITYAAHQTSPLNDTGSHLRFYLLGYLVPAFVVIILLIANSDSYYDSKLCWFNLDNLWINVSPMIAMVAVTFLVMIFSAKEQTESSYTKSAKANKLIANHTRGVWIQMVLLTFCWSFAFMSLTIFGSVIKYLFGFLNCLQGSFLFVFFVLINEETKKYLKERKRKRKLKLKDLQDMINRNRDRPGDGEYDEEEDEDDDEDDDDDDEETGDSLSQKKNASPDMDHHHNSDTQAPTTTSTPMKSLSNRFSRQNSNKSARDNVSDNLLLNSFSSVFNKSLLLTKMDSVKSGESSKNVKFKSEAKKVSTTLNLSEDMGYSMSSAHQQQNTVVNLANNGHASVTLASSAPQSDQETTPRHSILVKPSQLGLHTILKPASITIDRSYLEEEKEEDIRIQLPPATAQPPVVEETNKVMMMSSRSSSVNIDNIVWPQLRKKFLKNNTTCLTVSSSSGGGGGGSHDQNMNSPGADYYDTTEIKVTVL